MFTWGLDTMSEVGYRRRNVLAAAGSLLLEAACHQTSAQNLVSIVSAKESVMLEDFALSPDGQVVAFQFTPSLRGPRGIGLYEWQTGILTRIPNPPGKQLGAPSFSDDAKHLAVVIQDAAERVVSDIAVVDLATMSVTQVTRSDRALFRGKTFPVFQPDTKNILYVEGGIGVPTHFKLMNIHTGSETVFLEEQYGFYDSIFRPSFVDSGEIYFQANAPIDKDIQAAVINVGASSGGTIISYRLAFGQKPEILFPELERKRHRPQVPIIYSLSSSRDRSNIIGISGVENGNQIFKIESNVNMSQITNISGLPAYSCISSNGSVVAFGLDRNLGRNFDLCLLSMESKIVKYCDLINRINVNFL